MKGKIKIGYLIGSFIISFVVLLTVYLGLVMGGVVGSDKIQLTILSADLSKEYDGSPLVWNYYDTDKTEPELGKDYYITSGTLQEGHTLKINLYSSVSDAKLGEVNNAFSATVYNESGEDVTSMYDITCDFGYLYLSKRSITIQTLSKTKTYDGKAMELTENDYSMVSGSLLNGDTIKVTFTADNANTTEGRTTPYSNDFYCTITNSAGEDVTGNYDVDSILGTITINKFDLVLNNTSLTDVAIENGSLSELSQEDLETTLENYAVSSSTPLLDGWSFDVDASGVEVDDSGKIKEGTIQWHIYDEEGNDISTNFDISGKGASYLVDKNSDEATGGVDTADIKSGGSSTTNSASSLQDVLDKLFSGGSDGGGSGGGGTEIDGDGNVSLSDGDLRGDSSSSSTTSSDPVVVYRIYSTTTGTTYLRLKSFNEYTGTGFSNDATEYTTLLGGVYGANYLTGRSISASSTATLTIKAVAGTDYILPYYLTLNTEGYAFQTSDVSYSGSTESSYSVEYYPCAYNTILSTASGNYGDYPTYGSAYYEFVKENYLSMGAASEELLEYLDKIIEENSFDASDSDIISKVAQYVMNSATYNLKYDENLDKESDIVLEFLTNYKEGVCRHYTATATLLFRRLGIPARYTVGYLGVTSANNWNEVTTECAHAWVEVYIDGIGWLQVEVTGSLSDSDSEDGSGGGSGGDLNSISEKSPVELSDDTYDGMKVTSASDGSLLNETVLFYVSSSSGGNLLFRNESYGDYTGTGFERAASYSELIDDKYSANYLTGLLLSKETSAVVQIMSCYTEDYLLPYFIYIGGDERSYDVQVSDTQYSGVTSPTYSVECYIADYSDVLNTSSLNYGKYSSFGSAYEEYVNSYYTSLAGASDELVALLNSIIEEQGFTKDNEYILNMVAEYIQDVGVYDAHYEVLDEEDDVVYTFLSGINGNKARGVDRHFAAAATMLFRALGIPARYTTGYAVSVGADEITSVKNENAYAWVEVYLSGKGWVPVSVCEGGAGSVSGDGSSSGSGSTSGDDSGSTDNDHIFIKPVSRYVKYDSTDNSTWYLAPLNEVQITFGGKADDARKTMFTSGEYTYTLDKGAVSGEVQYGVGKSILTIDLSKFHIYKDGVEVTDEFEKVLETRNGELRIYYEEITITTTAYSKTYDGEAFTIEGDYSFDNSLLNGDYVSSVSNVIKVWNSSKGVWENAGNSVDTTAVGTYLNSVEITVCNSSGQSIDFDDLYLVHYNLGKLVISAYKLTIETSDYTAKRKKDVSYTCEEFTITDEHGNVVTVTGNVGEASDTATTSFTVVTEYADGTESTTETVTDDCICVLPDGYYIKLTDLTFTTTEINTPTQTDNKLSGLKIYTAEGKVIYDKSSTYVKDNCDVIISCGKINIKAR